MNSIKSIALVDASHRFAVNFHAQADSLGPNGCVDVTMRELESIRDYAQHVIVCVDRGPYWRHEVYPEYKAGRERRPEYPGLYRDFLDQLELAGFAVAGCQGFEADDVIATLCRYYAAACEDIRIVTEDKDALQLLTPGVSVHCWRARGEFEIRTVEWLMTYEKMGATKKTTKADAQPAVTPEQVPLLQAIMGDKGDNIRGVEGLGPVQGGALVRKFWQGDPLNTIAAITGYCAAAAQAPKVPAIITKWLAGCGEVGRWVRLTTLRDDVPLDPTELLLPKQRHPKVIEEQGDAWEPPADEALDEIFEAIDAGPSAEELAEESATMAGKRPAEDLISSPPITWLAFKSLLTPKQGVVLAGIAESAPYARELIAAFGTNLHRFEQNGTPYTAEKAAAAAYATTNTPGQKALAAAPALQEYTPAAKAASRQAMSDLADKVLPLPKAPASAAPVSSGSHVAAGGADPKAPSVDASTQPAGGTSTATERAPVQPEPTSAQAATPAAGAAHPSEVVDSAKGPRKPLPGQRVVSKIDETGLGIVAYTPPSWALSCQPASASHAFSIAAKLFLVGLYKDKFKSVEQLAAVILRGREMGIGMTTALDAFHVIQGKPCASAQLISALAESDPDHDYTMLVELDDEHATVEIKHKRQPKPVRWTFTMADAQAAGLVKPGSQWVIRKQQMLAKSAKVIGHRFTFPAKTLGLHALETEPEGQDHVKGD